MKLLKKRHFWLICGMLAVDGLFFGLSDPSKAPSLALIVGFILLLATIYRLFYSLLAVGAWCGLTSQSSRRRLAGMLSGLIATMVALQSIGQLGVKDILVLIPLVVGLYFYLSAARAS